MKRFFLLASTVAWWAFPAGLVAQQRTVAFATEPAQAAVYRDTVFVGWTPIVVPVDHDGWAVFQVYLKGYAARRESVLVAGPGRYDLSLKLEPCCELLLRSVPNRAEITLDDSVVGKTDKLISQVILGTHCIRLHQSDHWDTSLAMSFSESRRYESLVLLRPRQALLSVAGTPAGAAVRIDDSIAIGAVPVGGATIDWGDHILTIARPGYYRQSIALPVHSDSIEPVTVALRRKSVVLAGGLSAVVPGTGQLYAGRKLPGYVQLLCGLTLDALGVLSLIDLNKKIDQYDQSKAAYQRETECRAVIDLRTDMEQKHDAAMTREQTTRKLFIVSCAFRLVSLLDAAAFFPPALKEKRALKVGTTVAPGGGYGIALTY